MLPGLTSQQRQYLYELHNKSAKEAKQNLDLWLEDYEDEVEAYYLYEQELERAQVYSELGGFSPNDFIKENFRCWKD